MSAFRLGRGAQIKPISSAPTVASGNAALWPNSSDSNKLYYTTPAGVSAEVGGSSSPAQSDITDLRTAMSVVDLANAGATITDGAGSYTYGDIIVPTKADLVMTGVRVYWPGGHGALTYKLGLYNAAAALVTSVNVSINAAGVYTGTFAAAQTLTAFKPYRVSAWETSGAWNIYITGANISSFTSAQFLIGDLNGKQLWPGYTRVSSCYAAGDANPGSADATLVAGIVEPIFQ